jgi:site-specific recombinase
MKFLFLKMRVMWRRFRHGMELRYEHQAGHAAALETLLRRADPDGLWHERANWMIDVAEWLRHQPKVSLLDASARRRVRHQRLAFLLDWLDQHRDVRRQVQICLQKTLREASGAELFSVTGLPGESAFFSELTERAFKRLLPRQLSANQLPNLFAALFPSLEDAAWLLELEPALLERFLKLASDDGIAHTYWQQIEEALTYLTTVVVADGISPAFRQRLEPKMPLQATPFMALRREMEAYLRASPYEEGPLRSVRMLIAVCRAQTDRIYAHLDEYGVSVGLVYRLERMRSQLTRMGRLIDVRSAAGSSTQTRAAPGRLPLLLADLITAHHQRASVRSLVGRSFALLARKMVERNGDHGEQHIARDRASYHGMFKAAMLGGMVTAITVLLKTMLGTLGPAHFFEGLLASLNYAISFLVIAAIGGVLATKQPAVTAPALAARMGELETVEGLRALVTETAMLLRSQAAAIGGNLVGVIPCMLLVSAGVLLASGGRVDGPGQGSQGLA